MKTEKLQYFGRPALAQDQEEHTQAIATKFLTDAMKCRVLAAAREAIHRQIRKEVGSGLSVHAIESLSRDAEDSLHRHFFGSVQS